MAMIMVVVFLVLMMVCDVHGNWSEWSVWSGCSVTCDVELRKRSKTCTYPKPAGNGDFCIGDFFENTVCLTEPCNAINGGWSGWGSWESCSVTCGTGLKLRQRTCTSPSPSVYGRTCEGNTEASAVCVNRPYEAIIAGTYVAFIAHGVSFLANYVCAFPTIIFNEGNAYNAGTGHFTAPVDGIYPFTVQFCPKGTNHIHFAIEKGSASMNNKTSLTGSLQQAYFQ